VDWCWNCKIRQYKADDLGVSRCPLPGCEVLELDDPARTKPPTPQAPRPAVKKVATKPKVVS
jgi:hypothetical protein